MVETGSFQFPGNLDLTAAQEFRPTNNQLINQTQIPVLRPPHLYYPYAPQAVPFCDGPMGYVPHYSAPTPALATVTYVSTPRIPLAPQSSMLPPNGAATRALFLSLVPADVSESMVRRDLEVFGEVRGVQMERVLEGIVTVHFYDLRHAERALREIREQYMQQHQGGLSNHHCGVMTLDSGWEPWGRESDACPSLPPTARGLISGQPVWAHFIVPATNAVPDGNNQGTVVVFNLDPGVSTAFLKEIFQAFGKTLFG